MKRLLLMVIGLILITACEKPLTPEEEAQKQGLIEYLEVLDKTLPDNEVEAEGWIAQYNDFSNKLKENYGYDYVSNYSYLKNASIEEIIKMANIQWAENLYLNAEYSSFKASRLENLAQKIVECGQGCKSSILSFDEAQKIVDTGEYDKSLILIDGNYVDYQPDKSWGTPISNQENSCKEVTSSYTSQGLTISSCRYSSSKEKISITVENNSGFDLRYLEVEIYGIDSNGKTVSSDYTNHGSTIRNGASQTLEAYVDEAHSYEVEISKATIK